MTRPRQVGAGRCGQLDAPTVGRPARLPTRLESELARGLVVTLVIGCMLNSLLLDHTEGLFYAWLTGVLYGGLKYENSDNAGHGTAHFSARPRV